IAIKSSRSIVSLRVRSWAVISSSRTRSIRTPLLTLPRSVAWLFAAFELAAIGILCHVVLRPGVSLARRLAGMLADLGALSCCMHLGGETSLPLYPVYFLAIFANGFRFGTPHLLAATDVAAASFALAAVATEFFATHPGLSLGLLGGLIVPALYIC